MQRSDHVHLCLKIPPKYAVSYIVGFIKGKSAVRIHRELLKEKGRVKNGPVLGAWLAR